ncbi:hypothetical protein COY27_05480 [Candidatus Woesearchaeota archaeon CG_4_10_14_0_2_um_filter_33_13]|nr:MAG: hypothetical protein COY27_05480 [Candidatus Woesearchaeota archaeon CG_4_10_14_0_2_um_filter_33_13]
MKIAWTKDMSVNDKIIDDQHKQIFNELDEIKKKLSDNASINQLRKEVVVFVKTVPGSFRL